MSYLFPFAPSPLSNFFLLPTPLLKSPFLFTVPPSKSNPLTPLSLQTACTYFDVWGQDDPLWCLNTHDLLNPFFEARTLGNPWRTWYWFLCNEPLASWATGAPETVSSFSQKKKQLSIVSRKLTPEYWQRQCEMHFPTAENGDQYGSAKGKTTEMLNNKTGGWGRVKERRKVIWTNG